MPHRLAEDVEEERRVLHVGITRGVDRVLVLGDATRPSPFLDELDGSAPRHRLLHPAQAGEAPRRSRRSAEGPSAPTSPLATAAVAALKEWRSVRSKEDGVPAYVVLNDSHLAGIAERHPTGLVELRACPGIGPAKLESYGEEILDLLASVRESVLAKDDD